jgi:hypothetical protein
MAKIVFCGKASVIFNSIRQLARFYGPITIKELEGKFK